jgi:hypothetical protein
MTQPKVDIDSYLRDQFAAWIEMTAKCVTEHANWGVNCLPALEDVMADLKQKLGPRLNLLPRQMKAQVTATVTVEGEPPAEPPKIILPGSSH